MTEIHVVSWRAFCDERELSAIATSLIVGLLHQPGLLLEALLRTPDYKALSDTLDVGSMRAVGIKVIEALNAELDRRVPARLFQ